MGKTKAYHSSFWNVAKPLILSTLCGCAMIAALLAIAGFVLLKLGHNSTVCYQWDCNCNFCIERLIFRIGCRKNGETKWADSGRNYRPAAIVSVVNRQCQLWDLPVLHGILRDSICCNGPCRCVRWFTGSKQTQQNKIILFYL